VQDSELIFDLPNDSSTGELKNLLADKWAVEDQGENEIQRVYFDTFDWRLYNSGSVLEISADNPGYLLTWRKLGNGTLLAQTSIRRLPQFAKELVAPGLRQRLEQALGGRALMQKISIKSSTHELRLVNPDRKTLVRIETRQDRALLPHSTESYRLPQTLHLYPLRGFEKIFRKTADLLSGRGRLTPASEDPLISALACLSISPGDYSNKPVFRIDPQRPAFDALKEILDGYRRIMQQNIKGTCEDRDPEFLHDLLHAARRTQCLLNHYFTSLPIRTIELIKQDFDWIEKLTTPVRNLDIYLGLFDEFLTRVDDDHRQALEPLRGFLETEKNREQRQMRVPLESPRYRRTMSSWEQILNSRTPAENLPEDARLPIVQLASKGIYGIYLELIYKGREVERAVTTEGLLELQTIGKKLDYELETFASLYPAEQMERLLEALEPLQETLNNYYNMHLQHDSLLEYSQKMKQQKRTMPRWLEAAEQLADDREREERRMQSEFGACYKRIARKKMRKQVQTLFAPDVQ
jgi:CHAD domain-containing protein